VIELIGEPAGIAESQIAWRNQIAGIITQAHQALWEGFY